jgi:hypothetical protein
MNSLMSTAIGYRCLPRGGDSTFFRLQVIVDSIHSRETGEFAVILNERAPAPPGYNNQSVTVEIQLAGSTRIRGTTCWHDAGIVFRMAPRTLDKAIIALDPRRSVELQVFNAMGVLMAAPRTFTQPNEGERVKWAVPKPKQDL